MVENQKTVYEYICDNRQFRVALVFIVLLLLNYVVGETTYSLILVAYAIVMLLFVDPEYYIVPSLLVDTIEGCFLVSSSLTFSRVLTVCFCVSFVLKYRGKIRLKSFDFFLIIFGLYHLATCFWSLEGTYSDGISLCVNMLMIIIMRNIQTKRHREIILLLVITAFGYGLMLCALILGNINGVADVSRVTFDEAINKNTIAAAIVLCVSIVWGWFNLNEKKNLLQKIITYVFLAMCSVVLLFVGSRTAMLAHAGTIITLPLLNHFVLHKSLARRQIIAYITAGVVLFVAGTYILTRNFEIYERFTFSGRSMLGVSRRSDIWRALWYHTIPEHILFGIGFGHKNVRQAVSAYVMYPNHAHNMFLAILSETGAIGLLLYIICFGIVITVLRRRKHHYTVLNITLLAFCTYRSIGEVMINTRWFWIIIGFVFLLSNNMIKVDQNAKENP